LIATAYIAWNRRLVIEHFYVEAKFRGRGIGRRLMHEALEHGLHPALLNPRPVCSGSGVEGC
jgi:predicted GNAT family acetyltransferase